MEPDTNHRPAAEEPPDHRPTIESLESAHEFPGVYRLKVIGRTENAFEQRVVDTVTRLLTSDSELTYTVRTTAGGRHVALTLDLQVQSAEQVRAIYAAVKQVEGLTLLL